MLNQYHRCVQILRQIWNDTLQRLRTARRTCKRNDLAAALDRMSSCCNRLCGPRRSRYSLSLRCDAPFAIVTLGRAYRREHVEKLFFELLALCLNNIGWLRDKIDCPALHRPDRDIRILGCRRTYHDDRCTDSVLL